MSNFQLGDNVVSTLSQVDLLVDFRKVSALYDLKLCHVTLTQMTSLLLPHRCPRGVVTHAAERVLRLQILKGWSVSTHIDHLSLNKRVAGHCSCARCAIAESHISCQQAFVGSLLL